MSCPRLRPRVSIAIGVVGFCSTRAPFGTSPRVMRAAHVHAQSASF